MALGLSLLTVGPMQAQALSTTTPGTVGTSSLLDGLSDITPKIDGLGAITGTGYSCSSTSALSVLTCQPLPLNLVGKTLEATPATGYNFVGWTGCASVSGTTCTLPLVNLSNPVATFVEESAPLDPCTVPLPGCEDVPTAPDTTITTKPTAESGATATFTFVAAPAKAGDTFLCSITGPGQTGAPGSCTSPKTYSGLTVGDYTFSVSASSGGLPDLTPATHSWKVTAAPDTTITSKPDVESKETTATFAFAATPAKTGDTFSCTLSGPSKAHTATACTSPRTYTDLVAGSYTFAVKAKNGTAEDTTAATYTWTVKPLIDTKLTTTPATTTEDSDATFGFVADPAKAGDTFTCSLTGPSKTHTATACTSPRTYTDLAPGSYTFAVKAKNGTAEDATAATHTWTVEDSDAAAPDAQAPDTRIGGGPRQNGWLLNTAAAFRLAASETATYRCRLDGRAYSDCGSASAVYLRALTQRSHVLSVAAVDAAGNVDPTPATRVFTVPKNNTALMHSTGWQQRSARGHFLSTFSQTKKAGATLRYKARGMKTIALVASKGRGHGTVKVFLGRTLLKQVSLNATRSQRKRVIPIASFATTRRGTITIRVTARNRLVRIEGLGIASR